MEGFIMIHRDSTDVVTLYTVIVDRFYYYVWG